MKKASILLFLLLSVYHCFSAEGHVLKGSLAKNIDNLLQWQEKFGFRGSILIVKNGDIILSKGYGYANRKMAFHNTPHTSYYIASVSKPITGLAIMKLVEQKKINLYDPVTKFFTDVPENKKEITVEQLLTHTSGMAHTYSCDNIADRDEAVKTIFQHTRLLSPVGKKFNYSGDNYTLLAAIVEVASGEKFESFLLNNVLQPSGITKPVFTGTIDRVKLDDLASPSETSGFKTLKHINASWGRKGRAGMILSVEDLYKIDKALTSNKFLSANTVASILSPKIIGNDNAANYGYGFSLTNTINGNPIFGHSGDDDAVGHNVDYLDFPEDGIKIFIASNSGMYSGTSWSGVISSLVQKLLLSSNYVYPGYSLNYNEFQNYSSENFEKVEGVYQLPDGSGYHVWLNNEGQLVVSPTGKATEIFIQSDKSVLTQKIMDEASREEYTTLQNASINATSYEKNKATIISIWKSIIGKKDPFEKVEILGTANIWSANYQSDIATWVKFIYKDRSKIYRVEWDENNKITGFGGGRVPYPMMFVLKAYAKDQFVGFDVANGRQITVNFLSKDKIGKHMMELSIGNDKPVLLTNTGNEVLLPKRSAAEMLYQVMETKGIEAAIQTASGLKEKMGRFNLDAGDINDAGYKLLNAEKFDKAIAMFSIMVQAFPESANGFDSLGEAYMKAGNKTEAIKNYKKSLELDPKNDGAKKMIEKLNG